MVFQIGSALLDACVLSVLTRDDTYGYRLTQELRGAIDVSESTLYPVLRRLQKDGYLETYDKPFQGRNRRYYRITDDGQEKYVEYVEQWHAFVEGIEMIMTGGSPDESE